VVGRVARPASDFVHARIEAVLRPDVDGYDELNARDVANALDALDHIELLKVRRYEAAHKNRKTVLAAVDKALDRRVAALDQDAAAA
jgi:hypothetical protein